MRALDRKLGRDLKALWAQALTLALVIACGTGSFIGSFATYASLDAAREHHYRDGRFAQVFAQVRRAPLALEERLRAVAGIEEVQLRVVRDVQLREIVTTREAAHAHQAGVQVRASTALARMVGVPLGQWASGLNRLTLRAGTWPEPGEPDAIVVNEHFAQHAGVSPGDTVQVLIDGRLKRLSIRGVVLSPEYVWASRDAMLPDDEFGVFWIDRAALASALDLGGAFNSVAVTLMPGASLPAVIAELDRLLAPYGSRGAHDRSWQISNRIVEQELSQWRVTGIVLPGFFLGVSVFVLSLVMRRLVTAQRDPIAALKALGYHDGEIMAHYLRLAAAIAVPGWVLGLAVGVWLGQSLTGLYGRYFHFPDLRLVLPLPVVLISFSVTLAGAALGTVLAARGIVRMSPAQAMRPAAPTVYRKTLLERTALARWLDAPALMIARSIERRPLRTLGTALAMAGSVAVMVGGLWWRDAVELLFEVQFQRAQPADVQVAFVDARPVAGLREIAALPGAMAVQGLRVAPVRLAAGPLDLPTQLVGVGADRRLRRVVDQLGHEFRIPAHGLVLARPLASQLGVGPGDFVWVESLEARARETRWPVAALIEDVNARAAYVELDLLESLLGESGRFNLAYVQVDARQREAFLAALRARPSVVSIWEKSAALQSFRRQLEENLLTFTSILTLFAATMAVGVVYNAARIGLAERAWELATLRVLGLTRAEVSALMLGEGAVALLLAIPVGCVLGWGLAWVLVNATSSQAMQIPVVVWPRTYAWAVLTLLAAAVLSAWRVRRRIDRLDMVAVLKTRE